MKPSADHDPVLAMTATPVTPIVDPGDRVVVDIFIYGAGKVEDHHLVIHAPKALPSDGVVLHSFAFATNPAWPHARAVLPGQRNVQKQSSTIQFNSHYFDYGATGQLNSEMWITGDGAEHAPLSIEFDVSKHAPPGEHEIRFILVYSGATSSSIADATARLVVRSFGERHVNFFTAALTLLTFLAPIAVTTTPEPWNLVTGAATGAVLLLLLLLFVRRR